MDIKMHDPSPITAVSSNEDGLRLYSHNAPTGGAYAAGHTPIAPYYGNGTSVQAAQHMSPATKSAVDAQGTKPKQRRNKPTLSCLECAERKTKCDRARPCLACVKRQSNCEYTAVADIIASADRKNGSQQTKARLVTKPLSKVRKASNASCQQTSPVLNDDGWARISQRAHRSSNASSGSSPYLLSNVPYAKSSPSNVFGVGSQHPFSNYWTCAGGLPEGKMASSHSLKSKTDSSSSN